MLARRLALAAALLVPLGLLHAFVMAEIGMGLTDVLFALELIRRRSAAPLRTAWFAAAMLWWAWLLVCSVPVPALGFNAVGWANSFVQAAVIIRFLVFALALQSWVLTTPLARRLAWAALALSCLWIGVESWQQYLLGANIFGDRRWGDGALTGPFWKPRAGVLYAHLLFILLPPAAMALLRQPGRARAVLGEGLIVIGIITAVLIGQRMGVALTALGGAAAAFFIPRLRRPVLLGAVAGGLVLLATPVISPPTHAKLVVETSKNLGHFTKSPYGELFFRAAAMGLDSPWHGWGYNAFRFDCADPRFSTGFAPLGLPPTNVAQNACNLHPHNFYLQALEESGLPGLALFILVNALWLAPLLRGLGKPASPMRTGLFIGVLTYAWPIASTDAFPTLYEPGWLFFILGLAQASAAARGGEQDVI